MKFPTELNTFFKKQFDYLISKNYCFYFEGRQTLGYTHKDSFSIIHKDNFHDITPKKLNNKIFPVTDFQYYMTLLMTSNNNYYRTWKFEDADTTTPTFDAIKYIYTTYPEERKNIVTFFNSITNTPLNKCFEEFFDLFCNNKKDIINLIKSFPKTSLGINTIKLESLDSYLSKNGFTNIEIDKFFLSYFKNREHQLKKPENFPAARDFLLNKYAANEDLLKPYFEFFPALKNEFQNVDYSQILLPIAKQSTVIDVDLTMCMKLLLIDNWDVHTYRASVTNFRIAMSNYFEAETYSTNDPDGIKEAMRITFLHNNDKLTQELVNKTMIDYFSYLKINPEFKKAPIVDHSAWIGHYILNKNLEHLETNNTTSLKKKKI